MPCSINLYRNAMTLNKKQNHFDDSNWIKERENILKIYEMENKP